MFLSCRLFKIVNYYKYLEQAPARFLHVSIQVYVFFLTKYSFTPDLDKTGITTVMTTPKILAEKTQKQVGQIVSAERGEMVTFCSIVSAIGNTIPPIFIFPRVHYKPHFIHGAPEGKKTIRSPDMKKISEESRRKNLKNRRRKERNGGVKRINERNDETDGRKYASNKTRNQK
ncbi:hypothetical protein RN001_004120 [Aquatica leii]|uniref:Uncharacterized protein n=1 Tax=Aquatica leii TaxID=1421715 RepID=A0AAN7SMN1_9COLE|nr:hypothetical protein RN001_004120 [Aquatica leii]